MKAIKIMTTALFFGLLVGCADQSHLPVSHFDLVYGALAGVAGGWLIGHATATRQLYKQIIALERQREYMRITVQEDQRWMYHNDIVRALGDRYTKLLSDDWASINPESVNDFRKRIGLDPHERKPEVKTIPRAEIEKILHDHSEAVVCINGKLMAKDIRKVLEDHP